MRRCYRSTIEAIDARVDPISDARVDPTIDGRVDPRYRRGR